METKEVMGTYGSSLTPCTVFVCGAWYCVAGSIVVNRAANSEELNDENHRLNVENIEDVDCFTVSSPIISLEELEEFVNS